MNQLNLDDKIEKVKKELIYILSNNNNENNNLDIVLKDFLDMYGVIYKTEEEASEKNINLSKEGKIPFNLKYVKGKTFLNLKRPKNIEDIKNTILHIIKTKNGEEINNEFILNLIINVKSELNNINKFLKYDNVEQKEKIQSFLSLINSLNNENQKENERKINLYVNKKTYEEKISNISTIKFIELFKTIEYSLKIKYTLLKQKEFRNKIATNLMNNSNIETSEAKKIANHLLFNSTSKSNAILIDTFDLNQKNTFDKAYELLKKCIEDDLDKLDKKLNEEEKKVIITNLIDVNNNAQSLKNKYANDENIENIINKYNLISQGVLINNEITPVLNKVLDLIKEGKIEEAKDKQERKSKFRIKSKKKISNDTLENKISTLLNYTNIMAELKNNTIYKLGRIGFGQWMDDIPELNNKQNKYGNVGALLHQYFYLYERNNHEKILNMLKKNNYNDKTMISINKILSSFIENKKFIYDENKLKKIINLIDDKDTYIKEYIIKKVKEMENIRYDNFLSDVISVRNEISHESRTLSIEEIKKVSKILFSIPVNDDIEGQLNRIMITVKKKMEKAISHNYSNKNDK